MLHDARLSANAKLCLIALMHYAYGNKTTVYPRGPGYVAAFPPSSTWK
jgi:hypothetical protein